MDWDRCARGELDGVAEAHHPVFAALANTPQNHIHHQEGDAAVHTDMVTDATEELIYDNDVAADVAEQVRLSAWLHDIGKPATTVEVAPCEYSAPDHANVGAKIVSELYARRTQLWHRGIAERAAVHAAVRTHMWAWHPEKVSRGAALRTAHLLHLDTAELLWRADGAGRICDDRDELQERVDWARAVMDDHTNGVPWRPWPYIDELADIAEVDPFIRRRLFRAVCEARISDIGAATAEFHALARTTPRSTLLWTCGLPGAGKSTWARSWADAHDAEILTTTGARKRDRSRSIGHNRQRLDEILRTGGNVCVDATHMDRNSRDRLLAAAERYDARVEACIVNTDIETCVRRQQNRERGTAVGAEVIASMAANFRFPTPDEYDRLHIIDGDNTYEWDPL